MRAGARLVREKSDSFPPSILPAYLVGEVEAKGDSQSKAQEREEKHRGVTAVERSADLVAHHLRVAAARAPALWADEAARLLLEV